MKQNKPKSNGGLFLLLTVIVIVVVAIFVYFIYLFTTYDKTEYEVQAGSVVYDKNLEYIKVEGDAYITQKLDKNYYLYEEVNEETRKYNLGKNAVLYKEGDLYIYIYGTAYQVLSSGDVDTLSGETKVVKSNPTKFFKLDDRKYLMVDQTIKTTSSNVLNTKDYVIINMDKKGNPSFSNHEVDFKTISQTVVSGSIFSFDIANEKLTYDKSEIDLKNVIGSSNEYEPPVKEEVDYTDEKLEAIQNNIQENADAIVGYYDQYFRDVITSVNNLTQSVIGANNNALIGVNKNEVYYDFVKWLSLKSVTPKVASIEIEYSVFDPSDEYQVVYIVVDGPNPAKDANGNDVDTKTYSLNKNDSKYVIRELKPNTPYTVSLRYTKVGTAEEVTQDTVIVTTRDDAYSIQVKKITYREGTDASGNPTANYTIDYEMTLNPEYIFESATLNLYGQNFNGTEYEDAGDPVKSETILKNSIPESGVYNGKLILNPNVLLQDKMTLEVTNIKHCIADNCSIRMTKADDGTEVPHKFSYKFFNE